MTRQIRARLFRSCSALGLGIVLAGTAITVTRAQGRAELVLTPTALDQTAAAGANTSFRKGQPTDARTGSAPGELGFRTLQSGAGIAAAVVQNSGPRYPADLGYLGGSTVSATQSHAIYLNPGGTCVAPACWGDPESFLRDLGQSDFIHIVDQYTGANADGRYTLGRSASARFLPNQQTVTDGELLSLVHAAGAAFGTGYGHIYHLFLRPGTDVCFDAAHTVCYSPDNLNTFYFCAYHGSVDFPDIGHVLYSVEPFQNVPGCHVGLGTPNGRLVDSTNNVLSHELFEAITDPDGDAWWNFANNGLYGMEIGDECSFVNSHGFDPSNFTVGKKTWAAQPEYSNSQHACSTEP